MGAFLTSFMLITGGLLVCGLPVFVVAWRKGRTRTIKSFAISAGVFGLINALNVVVSNRLEEQCRTAGNPVCIDYGFGGILFLFVGGYLVASLIKAASINRNY